MKNIHTASCRCHSTEQQLIWKYHKKKTKKNILLIFSKPSKNIHIFIKSNERYVHLLLDLFL